MTDRLPWFPCNPSKFIGALSGMEPHEGYVYVMVCFRIYETGNACKDSVDVLRRRTGLPRRLVEDAIERLTASGKLVPTDAGLMNPMAAQVLADQVAIHKRLADAGREGGKKSAEKRKEKQTPQASPAASPATPRPKQTTVRIEDSEVKKEQTPAPELALAHVSDWPSDYRERFWASYPRKTEKKAAMVKLDAVKKSGLVTWPNFLSAIGRYVEHVRGTEERYIKHPTTWLSKGCWDDVLGKPQAQQGVRPTSNGLAALTLQMMDKDHGQSDFDDETTVSDDGHGGFLENASRGGPRR